MLSRSLCVFVLLALAASVLAFRFPSGVTDALPWVNFVSTEVAIEPLSPTPYDPPLVHAAGVVEGGSQATELRFEVQGRITHLGCSDELAQPQFVRKGDILARIDHTCAHHAVREAEALLAKARAAKRQLVAGASAAEHAEAQANRKAAAARVVSTFHTHRRLVSLAQQQVVADQDLEDAAANYSTSHANWLAAKARVAQLADPPRPFELQAADAEIMLADSRVKQAKATLQKSLLRAPTDAVVLRVNGEVGELTGPADSAPLITLVDASAFRVRAYVDELDALDIQAGQPVAIKVDSLPDANLTGRVETCLASMQPKTELRHAPTEKLDVKVREVIVLLDSDNPLTDRLVFGLPVEVAIQTGGNSVRANPLDSDVVRANHHPASAARLASTP